jgi:hypothetical protein
MQITFDNWRMGLVNSAAKSLRTIVPSPAAHTKV